MKRFPAEWETQDCIQLTWPHKNTDFSNVYERAVTCFVNIAREISKRQKLIIVCECKLVALQELGAVLNENILFVEAETNDVWARDHGAITIFEDNHPILYDFTFNGWGKKFPAEKDDKITKEIYKTGFFKKAGYKDCSNFVLEGGSIETDGQGVLLTTESCLLSKFRNPSMSKSDIESYLQNVFNLKKILWLSHGELVGDDTDGHIDTLARFVDERTIAYVNCNNANDVHYTELQEMKRELEGFRMLDGNSYNLIPLPMATPVFDVEGNQIPATYANFLIMNEAILLPIYNCSTDSEAIRIMQSIFPHKEIVPIDCSVLILQHGSLHCVTMQYPQGVF